MKVSLGRLAVLILVVLAIVTLLTPPLYAEIYKWVDENGVTHFSDRKPVGTDEGKEMTVDPSKSGSLTVIEGGEYKSSPLQYMKEFFTSDENKELNKNASVVIYTTPT